MSIFYTAFFIKTDKPEQQLKQYFRRIERVPDSKWQVCDWGDNYETGLFEPGSYFTKDLSLEFGEVIFVCEDSRDDQMEYEHSKDGCILRKLSWLFDGNQSTWEWAEGEKEDWEEKSNFFRKQFRKNQGIA